MEPRIPIINNFIEETLQHFEKTVSTFDPKKKPDQGFMEEGFINILDHVERKLGAIL